MPNIKTNLLRINFKQQYYQYQIQLTSKSAIQHQHHQYIQAFFNDLLPQTLFHYPYLSSSQAIVNDSYFTHFSDGNPVQIKLRRINPISNLSGISLLLAQKFMSLTKLLYSKELMACFNPFQQYEKDEVSFMPGWQISSQIHSSNIFLCINAIQLEMHPHHLLNQDFQILYDHDNGKFFQKINIVRVDKNKGQVCFRNGDVCRRQAIRPLTVKPVNGFPLAEGIQGIIIRMKGDGAKFIESWGIQIDSRFLEVQGSLPAAGTLSLRDQQQCSLSPLISPMSSTNFSYNYINFFSRVKFLQIMKVNMIIFSQQQTQKTSIKLRQNIQSISTMMNLEITCKVITYKDWKNLNQLVNIVHNQQNQNINQKIYVIIYHQPSKFQKELFKDTIQEFINQNFPFHLISSQILMKNDQEAWRQITYHHLLVLYTKCRLNPWKLINLPFISQPMMIINLQVQKTKEKLNSVAIVATMNLYFTKFTGFHKLCSNQNLSQIVVQGILNCVTTFHSKHNRYPQRVFLIHSDTDKMINVEVAKQQLRVLGSLLTYVTLFNKHSIRTYVQLDSNFISRDSVKKVQQTTYTVINQENYLQLELQRPPYKVAIDPIQKQDPHFVQKVLELISKVSVGGCGHNFGVGLGILDYAKKLNNYREYNLTKWQNSLKQGILTFL